MNSRVVNRLIRNALEKMNPTLILLLIAYIVISRIVGGFGLTILLSSVLISAS